MGLITYLKKRGLTLDVLDYQYTLGGEEPIDVDALDYQLKPNGLTISKVYDKWLSEQPATVQAQLPKHWTK